MSAPKRIQRKRTKGWRMPEGAVYVGRPTRWGNPYRIGGTTEVVAALANVRECGVVRDAKHAVSLYRRWLFHQQRAENLIPLLRGRDLACWCKPNDPCHADVLLEIANARQGVER